MLYTRKGDKGTTKTLNAKERISKASALPEALGTLDELNSYVGLVRAAQGRLYGVSVPLGARRKPLEEVLRTLQEDLFIVQAEVAGADKKITKAKVLWLERITDSIEKEIPPLKGFSVPGATELSALLDVARTMSRRVERRVVGVHEEGVRKISLYTLRYLNRLSSVLFALARYANFVAGEEERTPTYR